MLAANVSAADYLLSKKIGLFRNHEKPKEEKLEILKSVLSDFKVHMEGGLSPDVMDYEELINKIKNKENFQMLQTMILRSMQQGSFWSGVRKIYPLYFTNSKIPGLGCASFN